MALANLSTMYSLNVETSKLLERFKMFKANSSIFCYLLKACSSAEKANGENFHILPLLIND